MRGRLLLAFFSTAFFLMFLEGVFQLLEDRPAWEAELARKDPDVFRLVLLGGSTVLGVPVASLGFGAQLEVALRRLEPRRSVEVVNLGRESASSSLVRRIAEFVLDHGDPDLLVVMSAHNEFLNRVGEDSRVREWASQAVLASATTRYLSQWLGADLRADPMPARLVPMAHQSDWFRGRIARHRRNLAAIARAALDAGVPLLLLTAPANLSDWPPVHRDLGARGDEVAFARIVALLAAGSLDEVEAEIDALRGGREEDAMLLYLRGQLARRRGDHASARALLVRAKDLDPYPWRALSEHNASVRRLADPRGVHTVDIEAAIAAQTLGVPGFRWINDNVHPTPLANALIASEIAAVMGREGIFLSAPPDSGPPQRELERFLAGLGPRRSRQLEFTRLLLDGIYCMKTPYYAYAAARGYLERARRLSPENWIVWANLGTLDLLQGQRDTGLQQLRQAAVLKGAPFGARDRRHVPYLLIALERSRLALADLDPRSGAIAE